MLLRIIFGIWAYASFAAIFVSLLWIGNIEGKYDPHMRYAKAKSRAINRYMFFTPHELSRLPADYADALRRAYRFLLSGIISLFVWLICVIVLGRVIG